MPGGKLIDAAVPQQRLWGGAGLVELQDFRNRERRVYKSCDHVRESLFVQIWFGDIVSRNHLCLKQAGLHHPGETEGDIAVLDNEGMLTREKRTAWVVDVRWWNGHHTHNQNVARSAGVGDNDM